jgi:hypothetical protein
MKPDPENQQIQAWFSELRRGDEQIAPPFEQTWQAALRRRDTPRPAWKWQPRLALVAMLVIALGAMIVIVHNIVRGREPATLQVRSVQTQVASPPKTTVPQSCDTSIADWQSPTAFMLDLANDESSPDSNRPMPRDDIHFDF